MRQRAARLVVAMAVLALFAPRGAAEETAPAAIVIDDFENPALWTAHPADGVELAIGSGVGRQGQALRLDFAFSGGGYAVARRAVSLDLPENYAFRFRIRGEAPPNHIEFKLLDATGENVWWCVRRDVAFPADWRTMTIKKRHVTFAWGPLGGGEIRRVAALEIVVTAGQGGRGTLFVDDLELVPLPPPEARLPPPRASASSFLHGHGAQRALDGDVTSTWSPSRDDAEPRFALDFGAVREWGGLVVDWAPNRHAADYIVEASDDGTEWRTVRAVTGGNGGRDYLDCPESESRHVRLRVPQRGGRELALLEVRWQPLAWSATREALFEAIAREAPRGSYPRGISGEQSYWTVTGQDADAAEALLGEDGALEPGQQRFSVEPFLLADDHLITWADGKNEQSLANGSLPVPSVTWRRRALRLETTAFATGEPGASSVVVTYRLRDESRAPRRLTLCLAIRPFQVNPPAQFLNNPGGVTPIRTIEREGDGVRVNGEVLVRSLTPIAEFGATTFDGGDIVVDWLRDGRVPAAASVRDDHGAASAALLFPFDLEPGEEGRVDLVIPMHPKAEPPPADAGAAWVDEALAECLVAWSERTKRVAIDLPHAPQVAATLEAQLGYILVNRAGPAIRPGTRAYARSWIRDGALTASALIHLGHPEAARDFLEWYAPHQYENGKIPCVVDPRGADPVPEHDSCGEFVFLVAEVFRYTKDRALAERMWPRVHAAVAYLDSLRATRRTDEYRSADRAEFFGILPPSISHEGYSAKPMHSYWDDSWAFRGFRDAAWLAGELGLTEERARLEAIRDEFRADFAASVAAAMRRHRIDYIPGCADLGDFDATSTTIALTPTGAAAALPRAALERTFEKYRENFRARRAGADWEAYTPYEIRNIGAHVRLGRRDDALEMLEYFLADQRPEAWRQWPEIVWHDDRRPRFLGDLPHTWVGSDYIRSVLDMLVYVSEEEDALILGAGVPLAWLADPGLAVRNLPTPWGALNFTMRQDASGGVVTEVDGPLQVPSGGIRVRAPGSAAGEDVVIRSVPGSAVSGP